MQRVFATRASIFLYMRKMNSKKDRHEIRRHENKSGSGWRIDFNFIDNLINSDASKLKIYKIFVFFVLFVIIDYFLTAYAIKTHFTEFNPVVVFIYRNFAYPEVVLFAFKLFVIFANFLLITLMLKTTKKLKIFQKITLIYSCLLLFFSISVVVYDIGIITGLIDIRGTLLEEIIVSFYKILGLM